MLSIYNCSMKHSRRDIAWFLSPCSTIHGGTTTIQVTTRCRSNDSHILQTCLDALMTMLLTSWSK